VRARALPPDDPRDVNALVFRQIAAGGQVNQAAADPGEHQLEQRIREAHAAGRREGEAAGHASAAAEYRAAIERLAQTIQELGGLRARFRREAEMDLVQLALAIARRVLRRELAVDPDALHGLVIAALEKLQGQEVSRVRVHPSQAGVVAACLQKTAAGAGMEVVADPSREPGAVVFETAQGNLDASVDAQLGEIARGLADRMRTRS
jgi:flagellar assembly protein FliH